MSNYKRYFSDEFHYVFITVVTYKRQNILIENIDLLRNSFKKVKQKYDFEIYAICILENHFHCILKLKNSKNISVIIGSLKKYFSYYYNNKPAKNNLPESLKSRKEAGVWQRRFYDHIIRSENDLNVHTNYIHYNPYKHYGILPKCWSFSTFKKFAYNGFYELNWCEFKNDIELE